MSAHKFTAGEVVEFLPSNMDFNVPRGTYRIVRPLPAEGINRDYRVKHVQDGHERVIRESQLGRR
jgi:hypothetical protein